MTVEAVDSFEDEAGEYEEAKWQLDPDSESSSSRIGIIAADNCGLVAEGAEVEVLAIYSEATARSPVPTRSSLASCEASESHRFISSR